MPRKTPSPMVRSLMPNHSLKRSANGRPPWPALRSCSSCSARPGRPAAVARLAPTLGVAGATAVGACSRRLVYIHYAGASHLRSGQTPEDV